MKHNTRHISFDMSTDTYKLVARLANRLGYPWTVSKLFTHLIERGLPALDSQRKDGSLFELLERTHGGLAYVPTVTNVSIRFPGKLLDDLEQQVQFLTGVADFSRTCEITLKIAIKEMQEDGILHPEYF